MRGPHPPFVPPSVPGQLRKFVWRAFPCRAYAALRVSFALSSIGGLLVSCLAISPLTVLTSHGCCVIDLARSHRSSSLPYILTDIDWTIP